MYVENSVDNVDNVNIICAGWSKKIKIKQAKGENIRKSAYAGEKGKQMTYQQKIHILISIKMLIRMWIMWIIIYQVSFLR